MCIPFLALTQMAEAKKSKRNLASEDRPPQFVLLAFDGSSSLNMWRDTVAFASTVQTQNTMNEDQSIKFSYFINPTYYTEVAYKSNYITPLVNRSVSCIGWASPAGSVSDRMVATNKAFAAGHEIGSHANSHCAANGTGGPSDPLNGQTWDEENWTSEFTQFNNLFFNAFQNNKIKPPPNFVMRITPNDIKGFRAPALAFTDGLWPTLKKFNFKYDTSQVSGPSYWPQKMNWGGWNIPLANIGVINTNRKTLSMDYNWFVYQTAGESLRTEADCQKSENIEKKWCKAGVYLTAEKIEQLKKQMLDSYKIYFKNNYFGNRAPVQIGHHFSTWNGGAYWAAFKEFAAFVCSKPEVKCVTMNEYVKWLDNLSPEKLSSYRKGDFPHLPDDNSIMNISNPMKFSVRLDSGDGKFEAMLEGLEEKYLKSYGLKKQISVDFKPIKKSEISYEELIKKSGLGKTVLVRASLVNKRGHEVSWETYRVKNVGTDKQQITGPIENEAMQPETAEAHNEDY